MSIIRTPKHQESSKEPSKRRQHNTTQHITDENLSPVSKGLKIKKSTPLIAKKSVKSGNLKSKVIHLQNIYNPQNCSNEQKHTSGLQQKLNSFIKSKELNLTSRKDATMGTIKIPIKMNQNITLNINGDVSTINISTNRRGKEHSLESGTQTTRSKPKEYSFLKQCIAKITTKKSDTPKHSESIRNSCKENGNCKAVTKQIIEDFAKLKTIKALADPPNSTRNDRVTNSKTEIAPVMPTTSRNNAITVTKSFKDLGMAPAQAIIAFRENLLEHEEKEIMQFTKIYYGGNKKHKIIPNSKLPNNGWDDNKEFYIANPQDHLAYRYEIIKLIGKGSFGSVYKCKDHKNNTQCAIKILRNKDKFHKQGQVEVSLLKSLNQGEGSQYFVKLLDSFTFRSHIVNCLI
jgi:hypothetical protein